MFLTPVLTVALLFAQHAFTPEEIAEGGRLFQSNCVSCHGSAGDQVQGVALMSGKFNRASTDDDVARIIRNGVPGTAMQSFNFTEQQAGTVVAYLRSVSGSASPSADMPALGDVARGRGIFEGKSQCLSCNRVGEYGSRVGPDLREFALQKSPMPSYRETLTAQEMSDLLAYLFSLKGQVK